jgi:hypothetical protein
MEKNKQTKLLVELVVEGSIILKEEGYEGVAWIHLAQARIKW